jgi:acyl-CoA synthetase (AMP-forming)/AMP-acid ligase II
LNIVSTILSQARHHPTALAICQPGTPNPIMSYGRLALSVNNVAQHAAAAGLKCGDTVALQVSDSVLHIVLMLGLTRIGVVTLSAGVAKIPREVAVDATLTDAVASASPMRTIHVDHKWTTGDGGAPQPNPAAGERTDIARIVLTSGTTGEPKGVALTHDMIARRLWAFTSVFGDRIPNCSRWFVDVGLSSNYGFQWIMWLLSRGGAVFLRGSDPAETMQAFELYQVQCMVAAPAGVAEFLDLYEHSPTFSCPFEVILAGGSLTWKSLADRVRAHMCSHLVTSYGATEASPVATAPSQQIADIGGAVGYIAPGMIVEAVDDRDRALAPGETGLIRVRGEYCVAGYIGNPPGAEQTFRNGCFYPGDIGTVTADRLLVITGRQSAIINVGGNKTNPESIEQVLLAHPGVEQAAAISVHNELGIEEVWAAIVAAPSLDEGGLQRHCQARLPDLFVPRKFVRLAELPLNAAGKLDRRRLADLARTHTRDQR